MKRRGLDRIALAALRKATELLGLAIGTRLTQMREEGSPTQALLSRAEQDTLHLRVLHETIDILASRWHRIPDRHRPGEIGVSPELMAYRPPRSPGRCLPVAAGAAQRCASLLRQRASHIPRFQD
jgi:hypothetical protein